MSWYIKQVGDSSAATGVEFQVGHYTPDGNWEVLTPFIGSAQEAEEGARRLVSFLNGSSTPYMLATMDEYTTGDISEVLAEIRDSLKESNSVHEEFCKIILRSGLDVNQDVCR